MNRALLLTIFFFSSLLFSITAQAQGIPSGIGLDITASTDNPVPEQTVTITARSYTIDINSSTITWTINGKVVQKDVGATTLVVKAPALGQKLNINVTAVTTNGITSVGTISVSSGSVDMIIENNGYVPAFFKGKLPTSYQNNTNIVAIPHLADSKGVEYDPKNLIYQWKKNSMAIEDQSGYGKQSMTLIGDVVPRTADVTVTVSTRDGNSRATGYISASYGSPSLSFYFDDSLYGPLFNKAIKNNISIGSEKETSIIAVPFGFNKPTTGIGDLALSWMINGIENVDLAKNESITLRAPNDTAGLSNVELRIRNTKKILQGANLGFKASFKANNTKSTDVNF